MIPHDMLGWAQSAETKRHKLDKNTTDMPIVLRSPHKARCLISWAVALAMAGFVAGCTTAQKRDSPTNLAGVLGFRNAEAADLFRDLHRAGNLYRDFRPVMTADAVPMDLQYRRLYLDMLKERYLLPEAEVVPMRAESDRDFDNSFELVVLIYGGTNEPVPLEKANSVWRVLLRDDDGELLPPAKIEKIKHDSPVYQYLNSYFYGLDRWSQLYRMVFPKLDKTLVGKTLGKGPVQLIVTGVAGTVVLSWPDPRIFYRPGARTALRP
jgi:hypothetical protein